MTANINLQVTSAGQIIFEMSTTAPLPIEVQQPAPVPQEVHYREPQETAFLVYELRYEEEAKNYIVPPVTR